MTIMGNLTAKPLFRKVFNLSDQGLSRTGRDRISQTTMYFIFFICSDDKANPGKPSSLYPPRFLKEAKLRFGEISKII